MSPLEQAICRAWGLEGTEVSENSINDHFCTILFMLLTLSSLTHPLFKAFFTSLSNSSFLFISIFEIYFVGKNPTDTAKGKPSLR